MNTGPRRLAVHRLVENAAPIPAHWVTGKKVTTEIASFYQKADGLWWPRDPELWSSWTQRCEDERGAHLPWALWAALRALGADTLPADPEGAAHEVRTDVGDGALGAADGYRFGFRRSRSTDLLLRLGWRDSAGVLTPGDTIEEKAEAIGIRLVRPRVPSAVSKGGRAKPGRVPTADSMADLFAADDEVLGIPDLWGPDGFEDEGPVNLELDLGIGRGRERRGTLAELLDLEGEHAAAFLAADRVLGTVALLGPRPIESQNSTEARRRQYGYLDTGGALTKAGWWRLAYLSEQGIGLLERFRHKRLLSLVEAEKRWRSQAADFRAQGQRRPPHKRLHMRLAQQICLELMKDEGAVPLGVEYSAFAHQVARDFHRYRADALLRGRDGELIWVEVMRRQPKRHGEKAELKYQLLEEDCLPIVAARLRRPVRYILWVQGERRERRFEPETTPLW